MFSQTNINHSNLVNIFSYITMVMMVFVIMFDTVKARNSINELIKINKKWSLIIRLIISPTAHISDNTQTHTTIKKNHNEISSSRVHFLFSWLAYGH